MRRPVKQIDKLLAQRPDPTFLSERHGEQRLVLGSTVGIPMADISLIINQRRRSPILPSLIALLNRLQLTILVDAVRKHEDARIRNVPEVVRGRSGERPDQYRRVWSGDLGRIGFGFEFDGDRIDILNLRLFVRNHVCDNTRSQPERLPALGKRNLERLDGCFNRCDIDCLLVPTGSETGRSASGKIGKSVFPTHPPRVPRVLHDLLCANIGQQARTPTSHPEHTRRGWW